MNLKSKLLMVVSAVGLSSVSAAELTANPENTMTFTEALAAAVQRGDTHRAQELTECLHVMAEAQKVLKGIAGEWDALKTEMEADGLAAGVNSDLTGFGLPALRKIDTFAKEIVKIVPAALEMEGGAVPPSTKDIARLGRKMGHFGDALDSFGDRVTKAIEVQDKRSAHTEQVQPAPKVVRVKETNAERVLRLSGNKGLSNWFVREFNQSQALHRYNWATLTDEQLVVLIEDFSNDGYITMKKPLDFSSVTEARAFKKQAEPTEKSKRSRVLKACKNPGVPNYLIDQFIPAFSRFLDVNNRSWSDVSDPMLTDYIDDFLRKGGF